MSDHDAKLIARLVAAMGAELGEGGELASLTLDVAPPHATRDTKRAKTRIEAQVTRRTRTIGFAEAKAWRQGVLTASARAVFRLAPPPI